MTDRRTDICECRVTFATEKKSSVIKRHKGSSSVTKNHQVSSNVIKSHQVSSSVIRYPKHCFMATLNEAFKFHKTSIFQAFVLRDF